MKKSFFYISLFLSLILGYHIIKILIVDLERLTDYGFGYLTGKVILLMILLTVIFFTRKSIFSTRS
ncbi:hypothetical protein [Christiangramia gaetbulicola]|uniref:hypothetical protein n=1 Tax=Christiangramia gaetbulicola TaxID=703340 RepID=UPI000D3BC2B2|nr:hypothetical protein [Christiangramia gaetbulicola]